MASHHAFIDTHAITRSRAHYGQPAAAGPAVAAPHEPSSGQTSPVPALPRLSGARLPLEAEATRGAVSDGRSHDRRDRWHGGTHDHDQ